MTRAEPSTPVPTNVQRSDVKAALRISVLSVVWTVAASVTAIVVGVSSHTAVLVAFGAIGLVDAVGSVALWHHFRRGLLDEALSDRTEELAHRVVLAGLFAVGSGALVVGSVRLFIAQQGEGSNLGVVLAAVSLVALIGLAGSKRRIARRVASAALRSDGRLSAIGATQAGVTLAGTFATRRLGLTWADAVATGVVGACAVGLAVATARAERRKAGQDGLVRQPRSSAVAVVLALGCTGAVTGVMALADVSHTVAALLYVVVVVIASFLGPVPAAVTVLGAFFAENFFFTTPRGTLRIANTDDVVALVVFGVTAVVVSTAMLRVNELRRRSLIREREVRLRLELTEQLLAGADPNVVLATAQVALARLFDLDSCVIDPASGSVSIAPSPPGDRGVIDAFARDITTSIARARLDREVDAARLEAAVHSSRAAFLSAMTHNLRTPLATIKASVSTLLAPGRVDRADSEDLLVTARREVERLERLVTKVLHLSRIRSGTVAVHADEVDLTEVVASAVQSVWGLAAERGVRVLRVGGTLQAVHVDPTLIEVAVACLVENAVRYAPATSEVSVESGVTDGRGEIRVVDHGPGIPPAERAAVFEEFARGEGVHDATGAGLGLPIARAFVEAHHGALTVEDTPGGGATFVISLPT